MRVRALLTRDTGDQDDQASGTFQGEADALLWGVNMVGAFKPGKIVVRTDCEKRIEYSFFDQNEGRIGFLFISDI